ncbi:hypothetical protein ABZ173_37780, partial [Streptomyces rochei]
MAVAQRRPPLRERSGRSVTGPAKPGRWAARAASSSAHAERERNPRAQRGGSLPQGVTRCYYLHVPFEETVL